MRFFGVCKDFARLLKIGALFGIFWLERFCLVGFVWWGFCVICANCANFVYLVVFVRIARFTCLVPIDFADFVALLARLALSVASVDFPQNHYQLPKSAY